MLAKSHPMEPHFRRNFAARVDLELDLPKGVTYLRLKCPSTGGIFMGGRAVYRTEDLASDEARLPCSRSSALHAELEARLRLPADRRADR